METDTPNEDEEEHCIDIYDPNGKWRTTIGSLHRTMILWKLYKKMSATSTEQKVNFGQKPYNSSIDTKKEKKLLENYTGQQIHTYLRLSEQSLE